MRLFTPDARPGHPYWWEDVTWPDLSGGARGGGVKPHPTDVDLLVIGAGYTGLSGAIAAHDAGARVAVIDAGQPGKGASTRNGGMVGAHPRLGWDTLKARYGAAVADALFAEAGEALPWLKAFLKDERIDCDFQETGRIQLAYTGPQFAAQKRLAPQVAEKGGTPCHIVERAALDAEIVTPIYKGGMLFPNHAAFHPAKFLLGLLNAALERGIPVVPECPAQRVAPSAVTTPKGTIRASKILLATNGYTKSPFDWFGRRIFPLPSYLVATEPLSPNLIGDLAPGRRMMVETRARHSYFRISPDGSRILFGGRAAMVGIAPEKAAKRLHGVMAEIWPALRNTKLTHAWTGNTGYTFAHMPHVGQQNGLHFALGYSGGGTVLAPWLGRKAALQALDAPGGETAYSNTAFAPRWFYTGGKPHFMHAADLWYRHWVDRKDTSAARS